MDSRTLRLSRLTQAALIITLLIATTPAWATSFYGISASPNPSSTGSYTVTWISGCGSPDYWILEEDSSQVYSGCGNSYPVTGKSDGTYSYLLTYCDYLGELGDWICIPDYEAYDVVVSGAGGGLGGLTDPRP